MKLTPEEQRELLIKIAEKSGFHKLDELDKKDVVKYAEYEFEEYFV